MATLNGKNIWEFEIPFHLFAQGVSKCTPIFGLSLKNFYKIYSFTCSHWGEQNYRVVLKKFLFCKRPLPSFGQRVPKCTPISELFLENFLRKNFTLHLFGITKPNDTLFHRKMRKYFFGCRCFILLAKKSPFTYSHWEEANSNPVSKNILLFAKPLHLFGIRRLKRNLFFRKSRKIFLKKLFISKTSPHLFPLGEGIWG